MTRLGPKLTLIEGLKEKSVFQRHKITIDGIGPECSAGIYNK